MFKVVRFTNTLHYILIHQLNYLACLNHLASYRTSTFELCYQEFSLYESIMNFRIASSQKFEKYVKCSIAKLLK